MNWRAAFSKACAKDTLVPAIREGSSFGPIFAQFFSLQTRSEGRREVCGRIGVVLDLVAKGEFPIHKSRRSLLTKAPEMPHHSWNEYCLV